LHYSTGQAWGEHGDVRRRRRAGVQHESRVGGRHDVQKHPADLNGTVNPSENYDLACTELTVLYLVVGAVGVEAIDVVHDVEVAVCEGAAKANRTRKHRRWVSQPGALGLMACGARGAR